MVFLPIVVFVYFKLQARYRTPWLVLASLAFYSYWNYKYLAILVLSLSVNSLIARSLFKKRSFGLLLLGIFFNLGLLGVFKYLAFVTENLNRLGDWEIQVIELSLPLAISFFTFQQIAYIVDMYQSKIETFCLSKYVLFVSFFPQLIAGPIVHHNEMMPQFENPELKNICYKNLSRGVTLFILGLFKKVGIADVLSPYVASGFDVANTLNFLESWSICLAYSLQLYFDFSGYCDMAMGVALMFNITLPLNFNAPYAARNIQDFWRRWHMTLSRWLRDYLYIPLGGNRGSEFRTYNNILITFLLGGIWHGAGWTFVIWGLLHGIANVTYRLFTRLGLSLPYLASWIITFGFVNIAWVFFRANDFESALKVLKGMCGMSGVVLPSGFLTEALGFNSGVVFSNVSGNVSKLMSYLSLGFAFSVFGPTNWDWVQNKFKPGKLYAVVIVLIGLYSFFSLVNISEFLYFQF